MNDWYHDGGDRFPLGAMKLIGKVQGVMMQSAAPRGVPVVVLDGVAGRSMEWLIMGEDLAAPQSRVTVADDGTIRTARVARGVRSHRRLLARVKPLLRSAGYDAVFTQHFDISMNSHQCGTVVCGPSLTSARDQPTAKISSSVARMTARSRRCRSSGGSRLRPG